MIPNRKIIQFTKAESIALNFANEARVRTQAEATGRFTAIVREILLSGHNLTLPERAKIVMGPDGKPSYMEWELTEEAKPETEIQAQIEPTTKPAPLGPEV